MNVLNGKDRKISYCRWGLQSLQIYKHCKEAAMPQKPPYGSGEGHEWIFLLDMVNALARRTFSQLNLSSELMNSRQPASPGEDRRWMLFFNHLLPDSSDSLLFCARLFCWILETWICWGKLGCLAQFGECGVRAVILLPKSWAGVEAWQIRSRYLPQKTNRKGNSRKHGRDFNQCSNTGRTRELMSLALCRQGLWGFIERGMRTMVGST